MKTLFTGLAVFSMCLASSLTNAAENNAEGHSYVSSNKMIGTAIYDNEDNSIADVNSIVLNQQGEVVFAVVGVGGVAGIGETEVAVPWKALNCSCEKKDGKKECKTTISMNEEKLSNAPALTAKNYAELTDEQWCKTNAEYFGVEAPSKPLVNHEMMCVATMTDVGVENSNGEAVGELDAVLIDVVKGEAAYAIIGDGNFSEKYIALPFGALRVDHTNEEGYQLQATVTDNDLRTAPKVTPSEYPELDLQSVRDQIQTSLGN